MVGFESGCGGVVVVLIFVGNDDLIGIMIVDVIDKVGFDGVLFIELLFLFEMIVDVEEGMEVSSVVFFFVCECVFLVSCG